MSRDENIPGVDDYSGNPIISSKDIRPPEKWKPVAGAVEDWVPPARRGLGLFQKQTTSPARTRMPEMPNGDKPESITFPEQWPGVHCTDLGAVFDPDKVTVEVWKGFMTSMGTLNRLSRLYLADAIWYADAQGFGFTISDYCELTGLESETIRSYQSIGYRVPIANRILGPKPSVYAEIAPLATNRQLEVLKLAKANSMSRDAIRKLVAPEKKAIRDAQIAAGLRPAGRPPKVIPMPPPSTLADDMEKAANLVIGADNMPHNISEADIEAAQFGGPLHFTGSVKGAIAFLQSLPDTATVRVIVDATGE